MSPWNMLASSGIHIFYVYFITCRLILRQFGFFWVPFGKKKKKAWVWSKKKKPCKAESESDQSLAGRQGSKMSPSVPCPWCALPAQSPDCVFSLLGSGGVMTPLTLGWADHLGGPEPIIQALWNQAIFSGCSQKRKLKRFVGQFPTADIGKTS